MSHSFVAKFLKSIDIIILKLDNIENKMVELCERIEKNNGQQQVLTVSLPPDTNKDN
jgi:hypothetical protein